jgi:hypothetical protein
MAIDAPTDRMVCRAGQARDAFMKPAGNAKQIMRSR